MESATGDCQAVEECFLSESKDNASGCSTAGGGNDLPSWPLLLALTFGLLIARRRRYS